MVSAKPKTPIVSKDKMHQNHTWKPLFMTLCIDIPVDKKRIISLNDEPHWDRKISKWNKILNLL